jgi:hypothetical protein
MSQAISRMYASHDAAVAAATDLRAARFHDVFVVTRTDGQTEDSLVREMMDGYVLKSDAKVLAKGVLAGGTLVTVHAPLGTAVKALKILHRHDPIESGIAEPARSPGPSWDDAAPLSSALQLPVLVDSNDSFSKFWNLPVLTGRTHWLHSVALPLVSETKSDTSSLFGVPQVTEGGRSFSFFGAARLINNPAPLSSRLGLPVLSGGGRARAAAGAR